MSRAAGRIYDERGKLLRIECFYCDAVLLPGPDVEYSGWIISGTYERPGSENNICCYLCPQCQNEHG